MNCNVKAIGSTKDYVYLMRGKEMFRFNIKKFQKDRKKSIAEANTRYLNSLPKDVPINRIDDKISVFSIDR